MSGPLSSVIDRISRVGMSRAEARMRATLRRLSTDLQPATIKYQPPVRHFGDFQAARAVLRNELRIGDYKTPLRDLTPWELDLDDANLSDPLHRFRWLADMEALGTKPARERAVGWTLGWLDRFADGSGPGWAADVAATRFVRLLTHAPFLQKALTEDQSDQVRASLALHAAFLAQTQELPASALARLDVIDAQLHIALCLDGTHDATRTLARLDSFCTTAISEDGGITSRNPEDLLRIFQHLLWMRELADECKTALPGGVDRAIQNIAPVLRAVRLGDGTLARYHGGGTGAEGMLDAALAASRARARPGDAPAMGFARLAGARTVVIVDVARPPKGMASAHASTLAIEMSSGRRPLLVSTGPALPWNSDWARAPRSTAAHSTLSLDMTSSSSFAPVRAIGKPAQDALATRPAMVTLTRARDGTGCWMQARHDGYLEDYGLIHERRLFVSANGRELHGEDVLLAPDQKSQRRFQSRIKGAAKLGVAVNLNFHLHPDVTAQIDRASDRIHLTLASGEVWLFRHSGGLLDIEPSVYIASTLSEPVEARQIVIRNRTTRHEASFGWSLVREDDATQAVRDLGIDASHPAGH